MKLQAIAKGDSGSTSGRKQPIRDRLLKSQTAKEAVGEKKTVTREGLATRS